MIDDAGSGRGARIRRATAADCAAIHERIREDMPGAWSLGALESELARDDVRAWLALDRNPSSAADPDGVLLLRILPGTAEVFWIGVRESTRGRGLGRQLMTTAIAEAVRCEASELQLEVRAQNHVAIAFYSALDFEVVGRRPRYYHDGDDALLLSRELSS